MTLDKPESIADWRTRQDREQAAIAAREARAKIEDRAHKPLVGSVGDIGQGDLLGGGDLFARGGV